MLDDEAKPDKNVSSQGSKEVLKASDSAASITIWLFMWVLIGEALLLS